MSKTFADFLNNNPEFWDDHSDYPEAVKSIVDDWFFYRECCTNNDVKFSRMFGRKLDVLSGQFNGMYNKYLELYDIDPVQVEAIERTIERVKNSEINKIIERAIEESATNTKTLNTDTTKTGTETTATDATTTNALQDLKTLATSHTKTGTTTVADDTTTTYNTSDTRTANLEHKKTGTEEVDTTNTGTVSNSGSSSDTTYTSDYPQSSPNLTFNDYVSSGAKRDISNANTRTDNTAGTHDTTFNVTDKDTGTDTMAKTGTVTVDDDNVTTHNTTDADTGTVTDEHTGTISDDVDTTTTHNTSVAETGTISDATARTTSDNKNGTDTLTGSESETESTSRRGSAVDMFDKYFKLIKATNVIDWLLDKLDVCFVQVFDEEEEETSDSGSSSADITELQRKVNLLTNIVEKMENGEQGPYRIFDLYTEMYTAFEAGEMLPGTTIFVREDDRGDVSPYVDDGTGTGGIGYLTFVMPDGVTQQTLTITMNTNLERMSPQYNSNLYDYFNQIYELPETLSDIYDHYTLKNIYGDTVYPYYNFDNSAQPYTAVLDFEARTGGRNNSYYVINDNYELKYVRSV